ncbi:Eco57I restriction-modification methylase domain-containing protein [Ktedonobacter robiniae]|uniref:Eco57I restriction-modification methylase domain-containing protein n=1 Tax=Ktedonobacter robiniae TaxID=2778365 RepID=UPI001916C092|nr:N-6 DNA methylase [Ktedonobacter robiniae]
MIEGTEVRGNLDRELERLGFPPDGTIKPVETLPDAQPHETYAHQVVMAQLVYLPQEQRPEVRDEIIERAAYTWINRLLALRAMEVRGLIDNTLRGDELYSGASEKLFILRETQLARAEGEDNGWWGVIEDTCNELVASLPGLFALDDPAAALRPGAGVLVQCIVLVGGQMDDFSPEESDAAFADPDAIGWAYQFYQEESKANVDAKCKNGGKVLNRSELAAKTQLFTEPYMVQWLLQNSLGRSYHEFFPQSKLPATWPYYVQPEKLDAPAFTLDGLTLLDPCMGSGHFLRAAFDMFVQMYREQYPTWSMREIVDCVLSQHLFGIDLDPRAAQLTALTLYLRACELLREDRRAQRLSGNDPDFRPTMNLATTPTHLNKGVLARHLKRHPDDEYFLSLIKEIFAGLEQAELLGSLLRPREYLDRAIEELKNLPAIQLDLFSSFHDETLPIQIATMAKEEPGELKKLAFKHIIESFHSEVHNVKDVSEMLFGREAEQGVRLFQLLDRQYAVVVTNPPYLGSAYMSSYLRKYAEDYYASGKRDLCTVFVLRCLELCKLHGRAAIVTTHSWLFLRSNANFRAIPTEALPDAIRKGKFTGILRETSIETLTELGRYAFSEIDIPGNPLLVVLGNATPAPQHYLKAYRLTARRPSQEQAAMLLRITQQIEQSNIVFTPLQKDFLALPDATIPYYLKDALLSIFINNAKLKSKVIGKLGLTTSDDNRFLRYTWEVLYTSSRWSTYTKGGGYTKWFGQNWYHTDWGFSGARTKAFGKSFLRNVNWYFQSGWSYSRISRGKLGFRSFDIPGCIGDKGPGVYTENPSFVVIAQSHTFAFLLRTVSSQVAFELNTLMEAPIPEESYQHFSWLGRYAESLKKLLIASSSIERTFTTTIEETEQQKICCYLHSAEGFIETLVCYAYKLTDEAIQTIIEDTGTPAGWYPLIVGYDTLPTLPDDLDIPPLPQELLDYLANHERIHPDTKELARIKANLRALYEAGPGAKNVEQEKNHEDAEGEEDEERLASGAHIPIPTETFLEELSVKMQIHPISVYWLLEKLRSEGGAASQRSSDCWKIA